MSPEWIAGHVRVVAEGPDSCLLVPPSRTVLRVRVAAERMRDWLALLDGTRTREELLAAAPCPGEFAEVWAGLTRDGCVQPVADTRDRSWYRLLPQALRTQRLRDYQFLWLGPDGPVTALAEAWQAAGLRTQARACTQDGLLAAAERALGECGPRLVVCPVFSHAPSKTVIALDDELERLEALRLVVRLLDHKVFAGPVVKPGVGATMSDVYRRREAAAASPALFQAEHRDPPPPEPDALRPAELRWAAATLAAQAERWLAGAARAEIQSAELVLDCAHLSVEHHGILALPDQGERRRAARRTDAWHLRDPEAGVIRSVKVQPTPAHFPRSLHIAVARAADMRRVMDFPNDLTAFGSSWESAAAAEGPAIGELIERYCANWVSPRTPMISASYTELTRRGLAAVAPDSLVGYSADQHAERGFPFAPLDDDTTVAWVPGRGLVSGAERWVPACWVYVAWNSFRPDGEQRHLYPNLSGIAGGRTWAEAVANGLCETIERDASMVWWANTPLLPQVPLADFAPELAAELGDRFRAAIIPISGRYGLATAAACVRDVRSDFLAIGFATRPGFAEAGRKALAEGIGLQWTGLTMAGARPGSAQANVLSSQRNLKPFRADSRYLDSYRADFRDVKDLACQLQIYLDPRAAAHVSPWTFDVPAGPRPAEPAGAPESADALIGRVAVELRAEFGEEPIAVDLTTPDIAEAGFSAVRVLSPGLVPNFPAAFPQWGRGRVSRAAVTLGWRETPLPEPELNRFPLAHY
ncbi:YcaO-like family protein [Amycolatopsis sp. lyj-346]|uniref:YcaO-like family protein n=1 Tax=Amycolatopsis sp. lyj-346 TaxID=2789289 RepID=UPI00397A65DD